MMIFYLDREVEKILENAEDNTINNCAPPPGFDDFTFIFNESPPSIGDFSNNHSSIGNAEYCLPPPGFENCSFTHYDNEPENEGYFSTPPGFENVTFDYYDSRSGMDEYGSPLLYFENPAFNHEEPWNGNEDYYESFLDFQESTVIFNESSLEFEKYSEFFTLFSEIELKEPQSPYVRPATCKIIDLQDSSTQTEPNIVSKPWNGLTTIKNIIDAVYQEPPDPYGDRGGMSMDIEEQVKQVGPCECETGVLIDHAVDEKLEDVKIEGIYRNNEFTKGEDFCPRLPRVKDFGIRIKRENLQSYIFNDLVKTYYGEAIEPKDYSGTRNYQIKKRLAPSGQLWYCSLG
ncbi:hypothetical protein ACOME3_008833 [Neoechinorhynchus agilis]